MPAVKGVGEPCAGKPHARIDVAAGGNRNQSGQHVPRGTRRLPPTLQRGVEIVTFSHRSASRRVGAVRAWRLGAPVGGVYDAGEQA
jgi:hypothetical protein